MMLEKRGALTPEERASASDRIVKQILASEQYRNAHAVFSFVPFRGEVEVEPIIESCWQEQKKVYVPKVDVKSREMQLYAMESWDDLELGHYGIREPRTTCVRYDSSQGDRIDLILMPGVAFDREKGRLGYGAGYYDRFLSRIEYKPYLLAPAYAMQIVDQVPVEEWDTPIHAIVTEKEWIR